MPMNTTSVAKHQRTYVAVDAALIGLWVAMALFAALLYREILVLNRPHHHVFAVIPLLMTFAVIVHFTRVRARHQFAQVSQHPCCARRVPVENVYARSKWSD